MGPKESVEQSRSLMDKNRIARPTRSDERLSAAKSRAIKGREGKSGRRAAKAIGLTSGGLRCCPGNGTAECRKAPGPQCRSQQRA